MIEREFDAIIFDCDGTLVDSEPITVNVLIDFVGEFGLELGYDDALPLFVGRDMPGIISVLESRMGSKFPDTFPDEFRARQATALRENLTAISGAHDLLESLNCQFCVASNAPQAKIEINLTTTGLSPFFTPETTFSAYDINVWKPEPDLFLYAAERLNVAASRCVVIEDSQAGIDAGLAAGMQVIGYSHTPEEAATKEVPFVHCLSELIEVLS
ncbi:MAG: HAD family hydrolase [Mariniblastus sp.]|jgi:HAD superfamily hydrolase (TIGR01509 family)|nr:HAD family hydrolase [Mariniblastus sp.]